MRTARILPVVAVLLVAAALAGEKKVAGLFAPSRLQTASGELAKPESFYEAADCGECHVDQYREWKGSAHSRAHHDGIYRAFAELARKEAGEELYRFCSSCHAPLAVATGEIGKKGEATFLTDEGVTCDVCHNVRDIQLIHNSAGKNASIILEEGDVRYGPLENPVENPAHKSALSRIHARSELCSSCHTLVHPHNGLVIENTYEEWRVSPYAKAGINCRDCHMRTVDQALETAKKMQVIQVPGRTTDTDKRPDVKVHNFVGANTNQKAVGLGEAHAAEAKKRLQTATSIALELPANTPAGSPAKIVVAVTNVAAGHAIPTSITELRQVWIDLHVTTSDGKTVYRSGAIDGTGRVDPDAVMYHSVLVDAEGKVTYKPWKAVKMVKEKVIPPKSTVRETFEVSVPADTAGELVVKCVLRYRSAPQEVMDRLFGKGKFDIDIVDMASTEARLAVGKAAK